MEIQALNTPINSSQAGFTVKRQQNAEPIVVPKNPAFGKEIKTRVVGEYLSNKFTWLGDRSTPFNRFVIGAFAFATQPWIDLFNKDVDEDTRKASCLRTAAKIIVGTTTGILVRMGCIKLMSNFTMSDEELKESGKTHKASHDWLKPSKEIISHEDFAKAKRLMKQHRNAIGTLTAIAVMMFTDPPLTVFMTNFFNKKFNNKNKVSDNGSEMQKGDK